MSKVYYYTFFIILLVQVSGCKKYLDEKPDKKFALISKISDLQGLLDNYTKLTNVDATSDEASADNYYLTTALWESLDAPGDRRMYTWEKDNLYDAYYNDWYVLYQKIYYANTVLESVKTVQQDAGSKEQLDYITGQAYLIRGKAYLQAAIIWSNAYNESAADIDMGIPLRYNTDFNVPAVRSTLRETFAAITNDLTTAAMLLPAGNGLSVSRPNRGAALALCARAYLYMGNYNKSLAYSDSCLSEKNTLIDFKTIPDDVDQLPFYGENPEILYFTNGFSSLLYYGFIDSTLYQSFDSNDLRKKIYFINNGDGTVSFKGSYSGACCTQFSGIATDEVYLMRAESRVRTGNIAGGMDDLNALLSTRWAAGKFIPLNTTDADSALNFVLTERRKELIFRFVRWMDIKRLNKDVESISLTRFIQGQVFLLPPNDLRFELPIPDDVIRLSGMKQNSR